MWGDQWIKNEGSNIKTCNIFLKFTCFQVHIDIYNYDSKCNIMVAMRSTHQRLVYMINISMSAWYWVAHYQAVTSHSWVPIPRSAIQGGETQTEAFGLNADEKSGRSKVVFLNKTVVKALGYKTPWCIARGNSTWQKQSNFSCKLCWFSKRIILSICQASVERVQSIKTLTPNTVQIV